MSEKQASYYQVEAAWERMENELKGQIVDADDDDDLRQVRAQLRFLRDKKNDFLHDIRDWTY